MLIDDEKTKGIHNEKDGVAEYVSSWCLTCINSVDSWGRVLPTLIFYQAHLHIPRPLHRLS